MKIQLVRTDSGSEITVTRNPPKVELPTELSENELALVISLTNYKDESKEGWLRTGDILKERDPTGRLLFKSSRTAFSFYINSLIRKGIVESQRIARPDNRDRTIKPKEYRLKKDPKICYHVRGLILVSLGNQVDLDEVQQKYYHEAMSRNYFKHAGQGYAEAIAEQIQEYKKKIRLLEMLQRGTNR